MNLIFGSRMIVSRSLQSASPLDAGQGTGAMIMLALILAVTCGVSKAKNLRSQHCSTGEKLPR